MNSCIYEGRVRHRRFSPVAHPFDYGMFMMYLDLGELDELFRGRWLWSARRPALAWFRRADHYGDPSRPLDDCIRDLVEAEMGRRPLGPIRLLTHLRYLGYCMNPVSFYYCFRPDSSELDAIVAEVNNTPWGERHCYVLPSAHEIFPKQFHVSPFLGMAQTYEWSFNIPGETLAVHMENIEDGRKLFDATLTLEKRPASGRELTRALIRYPLMTVKVIAAIYWQAAKLWMKRCPVYEHPNARPKEEQIAHQGHSSSGKN